MKYTLCLFLISSIAMAGSGKSSSPNAEISITIAPDSMSMLGLGRGSVLSGHICEVTGARMNIGERGCFMAITELPQIESRRFVGTMTAPPAALAILGPSGVATRRYVFKAQNDCWFQVDIGSRDQNGQIALLVNSHMYPVTCQDYANTNDRTSGDAIEQTSNPPQVAPVSHGARSN